MAGVAGKVIERPVGGMIGGQTAPSEDGAAPMRLALARG
jgi:hypothetical protein